MTSLYPFHPKLGNELAKFLLQSIKNSFSACIFLCQGAALAFSGVYLPQKCDSDANIQDLFVRKEAIFQIMMLRFLLGQ